MVSPLWVEKGIQVDGRKQAEIERGARSELLDDLPGSFVFLVGVGPCEVEVELIEGGFGEKLGAAGEGFQVIKFIFDEPMHGFDIALIGVSGGGDALVLAVAESGRKTGTMAEIVVAANELRAVVGLPSEVLQFDAAAGQVRLDALGEQSAGGGRAARGEGQEL